MNGRVVIIFAHHFHLCWNAYDRTSILSLRTPSLPVALSERFTELVQFVQCSGVKLLLWVTMADASTAEPYIDPALLSTLVESSGTDGSATSLAFKSGNSYAGSLAGSTTMHGNGTYKWASSGVSYTGDFEKNLMTGNGRYEWPDGSAYEGEVRGGIRHGVGTFTGPGGFPRYEGQGFEGRRHGKGKLAYSRDGDVYDGEWADDMREGQGVLTHASGNTPSVKRPL